jgi:micrococcal nuclease
MRQFKLALCLILLLGTIVFLAGQEQTSKAHITISAAQASQHIGETATVCGKVVDARYASSSRGKPTFLNLDKPYPNQIFTVVIWGKDRDKFGKPEEKYKDKYICVTGDIISYRGIPEIIVRDPSQIRIVEKQ